MNETFRLNPCLISREKQIASSLSATDVSNISVFIPGPFQLQRFSLECRVPVGKVSRSVGR